jgi:hypothetical protein
LEFARDRAEVVASNLVSLKLSRPVLRLGHIRVWDIASGTAVAEKAIHPTGVLAHDVAANGNTIVAVTASNEVVVLHLERR